MSEEMTFKEHAENLIQYFAKSNTEFPEETWRLGEETAREWLRLINSESVLESEVGALIATVTKNKGKRSGWFDLALGVNHWAKSNGFPGVNWLAEVVPHDVLKEIVMERKQHPEELKELKEWLIGQGVCSKELNELGFD